MEKWIKDVYDEAILTEALARYQIQRENLEELDGFESFIYGYARNGAGYILRVSHSSHRTWEMIMGEMEWLSYLAAGGLSVARPVRSCAGNLVEVIGNESGSSPASQPRVGEHGYFTVASYERAEGQPPKKAGWTPELFQSMGRFMGRMHSLAKDYTPSAPAFRRPDWDSEGPSTFDDLPETETTVVSRYLELVEHFRGLARCRDSYGLIHVDFHSGNFFVDDGRITLFDFDDCQYSWFIYDIAMSIFYALPVDCVSDEDVAKGVTFFTNFMKGYMEENRLDPKWLQEIPHFLRFREVDLYMAILRSGELAELGAWGQAYMKNRREKIESRKPYAPINFASLL